MTPSAFYANLRKVGLRCGIFKRSYSYHLIYPFWRRWKLYSFRSIFFLLKYIYWPGCVTSAPTKPSATGCGVCVCCPWCNSVVSLCLLCIPGANVLPAKYDKTVSCLRMCLLWNRQEVALAIVWLECNKAIKIELLPKSVSWAHDRCVGRCITNI